jgi:hypothetical protein
MSHYVAVSHLPADGERLQTTKFIAWRTLLMAAGAAGVVISLLLFFMGGKAANAYAFSYLFAFEVFFTIAAGSLFWCLLHNASNSAWGVAIRRIPETLAQSFVVLGLLGLPLFVPLINHLFGGMPEWTCKMWEWIGIHQELRDAGMVPAGVKAALAANHDTLLLYKKYNYLHLGMDGLPGWDMRYVIYFIALAFTAKKLLGYSLHQDQTGDVRPTFSARRFSCGMLPVFAVCTTFASIDWVKGLNYKWFSTMFGVNIFAGSALCSMAVIILIVGTLVKTGHLKHIVSEEHFHLMGKLMFAFTIFWAYIAFSQYFLIWYANIPEETQFYAIRNTGGWWYFSVALVFGHFVAPFVLLLRRNAKRKINYVMGCAALVIAVHVMEMYWMIMPERGRSLYPETGTAPDAMTFLTNAAFDVLAFVTFAAVVTVVFIRNLSKHSIYPCGDPRLEESVNVAN